MIPNDKLRQVFDKTKGHCHFCGDKLIFRKYGLKDAADSDGGWEADHVIQRGKGGSKDVSNCLPCCIQCNRLRWHRKGGDLRDLIILGLVAHDEIKKRSPIGKELIVLKNKRLQGNINRRRRPIIFFSTK